MDHDDAPFEELLFREAALNLVRDTPEGRVLDEKLEAFDKLDDAAKKEAAQDIREDLANIVARAVTEEHHRRELIDALANFRDDRTVAASEPSEIQEQHPLVAQLLDVVEDMLVELGKEMLIEVLLPGAHILLPPTSFVESVFTAVAMFEIGGPAKIEVEEPAMFEVEGPAEIEVEGPAKFEVVEAPEIEPEDPADSPWDWP